MTGKARLRDKLSRAFHQPLPKGRDPVNKAKSMDVEANGLLLG